MQDFASNKKLNHTVKLFEETSTKYTLLMTYNLKSTNAVFCL